MWQSSCNLNAIAARADLYSKIRLFFNELGVVEVETPILARSTATDPYLQSVRTFSPIEPDPSLLSQSVPWYLHTSPEFPMKRLIASGAGSIYQICKCFRSGESGGRHNPEFSMLEWYRDGFGLEQLIEEVFALINFVLTDPMKIERLSYKEAFRKFLAIDPFAISDTELRDMTAKRIDVSLEGFNRDDCLDLLLSHFIEPRLGDGVMTVLQHYPVSQAALAKTRKSPDGYDVAERFEVYIKGLELANGYHELTDPVEQRKRFEADNEVREVLGKEIIPIDEHLLSALTAGFPNCSGVALGLDRLLMVAMGVDSIDQVLTFPVDRV